MITGIILSAGESKRMGTPKQLLPWGRTIILQQVIDNAQASRLDKVLLILGSHADEIKAKITIPSKFQIILNANYKEGMSSSVKCGVKNAPPEAEAYVLLLGDQPFISSEIINRVLNCYQTHKQGIVIPVYYGQRGHPVVFSAKYKKELLDIGEGGAKVVVENHPQDILEVAVSAPEILADIDTPQDYQKAVSQAEYSHNKEQEKHG